MSNEPVCLASNVLQPLRPKLCRDCRWYRSHLINLDTCAHPSLLDNVTGKASYWCKFARDTYGDCGREAKLFEPK